MQLTCRQQVPKAQVEGLGRTGIAERHLARPAMLGGASLLKKPKSGIPEWGCEHSCSTVLRVGGVGDGDLEIGTNLT